jgi:hypothetical protein
MWVSERKRRHTQEGRKNNRRKKDEVDTLFISHTRKQRRKREREE